MIDEVLKCENRWGHLVYAICEEAERRFAACGVGDDFCLQCWGMDYPVFGGTNRVCWRPTGFRPDTMYCTREFLENRSKLD